MKISLVSVPVQSPVEAHEIYTTKLGFISREFDANAGLAIIASPGDQDGTAILLEPCHGTFAEDYQKSAFKANLPIMVFAVTNVESELDRLQAAGVKLRPELDNPDCGLENMFEDGCGNILMLEQLPSQ